MTPGLQSQTAFARDNARSGAPESRSRSEPAENFPVFLWCSTEGRQPALLSSFDEHGFVLQGLARVVREGRHSARLSVFKRVVQVPVDLTWQGDTAIFSFVDRSRVADFARDLRSLRPEHRRALLHSGLGRSILLEA